MDPSDDRPVIPYEIYGAVARALGVPPYRMLDALNDAGATTDATFVQQARTANRNQGRALAARIRAIDEYREAHGAWPPTEWVDAYVPTARTKETRR